MERNEYEWDVFVSHNRRQKPWVRQFVQQLRDIGLRVFFDEDSIKPGEEILEALENGLKKSRFVVFVISPTSVLSRWVAMELAIAIFQDVNTQERRIRPVLLEPTNDEDIRPAIRMLNRVELADTQVRQTEYQRLISSLIPDSATSVDPLPLPPAWPGSTTLSSSLQIIESGKAVAIGAHWDDILLGCLGTLLKLRLLYDYQVSLVVLCTRYRGKYYGFSQHDLEEKVHHIYGELEKRFNFELEVGKTPGRDGAIEDRMFRHKPDLLQIRMDEIAKKHVDCNLIFIPPIDDAHEDHAFTGKLADSYFRQPYHLKLEYEIKRYTDRSFVPNVFVDLDDNFNNHERFGDLKINQLSKLIVEGKDMKDKETDTKIEHSDFLFGKDALKARLMINALDYSGDKNVRYGEAFRGRIAI